MKECSGNKICINYWFPDCWIRKPDLYYGLVDPEWFFTIMDFWIRNAYFELRIGGSRRDFSIMDVLHFLFWINTIIHVLPKASIWEITGCTNPKIYRKRQSENLLDFIIRNTKKMYSLHRDIFVFAHFVGVQEEKCRGAGRNCHFWTRQPVLVQLA